MPDTRCGGNPAFFPALYHDAVQKDDRVNVLQRTALPGPDLLHNALGGLADQSFGNIHLVHISRHDWMSRTLIPRHTSQILSSKPSKYFWRLGISWGSKLPLRSRGGSSSTCSESTTMVFLPLPLRELHHCYDPWDRVSYNRDDVHLSMQGTFDNLLLSWAKRPVSPQNDSGPLYSFNNSSSNCSCRFRSSFGSAIVSSFPI